MSRYRGLIVLLIDIALIFCWNFVVFLPELLTQAVRPVNLVLHIGLLTACVLVFQFTAAI